MPAAIVSHSNPNSNPMDRPNPLSKPHLVKQRRRGVGSNPRSANPNPVKEQIHSSQPFDFGEKANSSGLFSGIENSSGSFVFGVSSSKNAGSEKGENVGFGSNFSDGLPFGTKVSEMDSSSFLFGNSTLNLSNLSNVSGSVGDVKENNLGFTFGGSENSNASSSNLHEKVQTWNPFSGPKENSRQPGCFVFGEKPKKSPSSHEKNPKHSDPTMANLNTTESESETARVKSDLSGNFMFGASSSLSKDKTEIKNIISLEEKLEKEVRIGSSSTAPEKKDDNAVNDSSGIRSENTTHQKEESPSFAFGSSEVNSKSENLENNLPGKVKNLNLGTENSNKKGNSSAFIFGGSINTSTVFNAGLHDKMSNLDIKAEKKDCSTSSNFSFNKLPEKIQKLNIGTENQNSFRARNQRNVSRDKKVRKNLNKMKNPTPHQIPVFVPAFTPSTGPSSSEKEESVPVPAPEPMECSPYRDHENPNESENENPKTEEKEKQSVSEPSGSFKGFEFNASQQEHKKDFVFTTSNSAENPATPVPSIPPVPVTSPRRFRRKNNSTRGPAQSLNSQTRNIFVQPTSPITNKTVPPVPIRTNKEETSSSSKTDALETCEKWRIRGNQSYTNGKLNKAEEYYTRGILSVSSEEASGSSSKALMLCYSNRAATRMALGRMREALNDCLVASGFDRSFLRAHVRAANCLLALGEIENAIKHYNHCLQFENADSKIVTEASEGIDKAKKMVECVDKATELLKKKTSNEITRALELISEALVTGTNWDNLTMMKAKALLLLRRYDEVVELCEQSLKLAQKNSNLELDPRLWRWGLVSKSYFYLGKLEEALDLLKKHEEIQPITNGSEEYCPSRDIICELLRLKARGNEAFQAGRYSEAVESYSATLTFNGDSSPFSSICFGNRAAAYQALGQVMDAIADCSLAIALDPNYAKAISRRATLYEMIRDYGQAANDLSRLISILEKSPRVNNSELNKAHTRLSSMEEENRKRTPLNMYLILGIEQSSSAADVKKAYRKAALRHHPDKAGQFLVRSETLDDSTWSEISNEVHKDSDHLFKIIGEAYNVLSDPAKRMQYDAEEEMKSVKRGYYNGTSTEEQNSKQQYYRSGARPWRSPRSQQHRWSEAYDPYW